jgi:phosphoribosylaminoimidazole-succinocarboxamide synthase
VQTSLLFKSFTYEGFPEVGYLNQDQFTSSFSGRVFIAKKHKVIPIEVVVNL